MKSFQLGIALLLISLTINAQTGIKFKHINWAEVQEEAKSENKMIFIDCYTTWCGPCKKLSKEIFPQEIVGEYFNENFISIKVDMEKGEGIELRNKFKVNAFPTMLFISKEGKEIHRIVGYFAADKLIAQAKKAKQNVGLSSFVDRYNNGERSQEFLMKYISVLSHINNKKELSKIIDEYMSKVADVDLIKKENWQIILKYIYDPYSREIKYVQKNKAEFCKVHEKMAVEYKLLGTYISGIRSYGKFVDDKYIIDEAGYKKYLQMLEDMDVYDREYIKEGAELSFAQNLNNWSDYVRLVDAKIDKMRKNDKISPFIISSYANRLEKYCDQRQARDKAIEWMELAIENIHQETPPSSLNDIIEKLKKERVQKKH